MPESDIPPSQPEQVVRRQQDILTKLAAIPGVVRTGFSNSIPLDTHHSNDPVFAQDRTYAEGELPPLRRFKFISPGFFSTIGTR